MRIRWQYFLVSLIVIHGSRLHAQIDARPVQHVPETMPYKSKLDTAISWKAVDGVHYVLLSKSDAELNARQGLRNALVYAYHYLQAKDSVKLLWKVQDGIIDCEVDYHADFISGALGVTDLDHNGIEEIWLMYSMACRGDIGPSALKVILYEGAQKFAMRGSMTHQYAREDPSAGKYTFDTAFKNSNPALRGYAIALWEKYKEEKW